jgi:hypothetical protein
MKTHKTLSHFSLSEELLCPKFIRLLHSSPRQCQLPTHLGVAQVVLADNGTIGCVANGHTLYLPTETVTKGIHAGNWHSIWSQHSMVFIEVIVLQPSPSASGWTFLRELRLLKLAYQWHQTLSGRGSTLSIRIRMEILQLCEAWYFKVSI